MDNLTTIILQHEVQIRLSVFFGILVTMVIWEIIAPRLTLTLPRSQRWPANLGIVVLNTVLVRLIFPMAPVGIAVLAASNGWGLFNGIEAPQVVVVIICVLILDLAIYVQHVIFHKVPVLWRLHRMHHADTGYDVTTGARFHPIEILISIVIKMAIIIAIGAPPEAVIIFEVLLNGTAMFNHGKIGRASCRERV